MKTWHEYVMENRLLIELSFTDELKEFFSEMHIEKIRTGKDLGAELRLHWLAGHSKQKGEKVYFDMEFLKKSAANKIEWCNLLWTNDKEKLKIRDNQWVSKSYIGLNDAEEKFLGNFDFSEYVEDFINDIKKQNTKAN